MSESAVATVSGSLGLALASAERTSNQVVTGLSPIFVSRAPRGMPARSAGLRLVLSRPEWAKAFLDAVKQGKARFDMLELDQKTALAAHPDRAIAERPSKSGKSILIATTNGAVKEACQYKGKGVEVSVNAYYRP